MLGTQQADVSFNNEAITSEERTSGRGAAPAPPECDINVGSMGADPIEHSLQNDTVLGTLQADASDRGPVAMPRRGTIVVPGRGGLVVGSIIKQKLGGGSSQLSEGGTEGPAHSSCMKVGLECLQLTSPEELSKLCMGFGIPHEGSREDLLVACTHALLQDSC